ncbi:MAG: autoinducer binding domain-containing protein, partial [Pseudomonadota bacterium]
MSKYWEKTKGFFRACNQVETLDALADAFVRYAEPLGVELVHAGVVWAADERSFLDAGFGTTDPEYGVIYRKERFIANDIIAQAAIKENLSFFWSEELAKRTLTKEEETVIQTAAEFHAKDG